MSGQLLKGFSKEMTIEVSVACILFEEDNITLIYSPALDITGYGKDKMEAKKSFKIALEEFIKYTLHKGTFESEMKRMGWKVHIKKHTYEQPFFDKLLTENDYLSHIVRDKEFSKFNQNILLPAEA